MAIFLDQPLSDEALFSVIARYLRDDIVADTSRFCKVLFGYEWTISMGLAFNLEHMAAETRVAWGMSAEEIRDQLTLYPYFSAFYSEATRARIGGLCLRSDPQDAMHRTRTREPVERGAALQWLGLRYCERCWTEDVKEGIPQYWRRQHQLPGVATCTRHGCALHTCGTGTARNLLESARRCEPGARLDLGGNETQQKIRHEFSLRSAEVLMHGRDALHYQEGGARIQCAQTYGYASRAFLDIGRLSSDLARVFGRVYLEALRLFPRGTHSWVYHRMRGRRDASSALANMILEVFFTDLVERMTRSPTPVCPSNISGNSPRHRFIVRDHDGDDFHCFCSCGFSFMHEWNADSRRVRLTPTAAGPDFALAVALMSEHGYLTERIAETFDLRLEDVPEMIRHRAEPSSRKNCTEHAKILSRWVDAVYRCGSAESAMASNLKLWRTVAKIWRSLPAALTPQVSRD